MIETGDFIVPYYNCQERFEKPPLLYYITALSFKVFGVNEFSARLPSGLAATGVCIMVYLLGLEFMDKQRALYGALVYCLLVHNWIEARAAVPEMTLTFFMTLGLYLFIKSRFTLGWTSIALAFLTKGPVGVVLPVGAYLLWKRDLRFVQLKGLVIFALLGGSWYMAMIAKYTYKYFYRFFIYENIMRYTGQRKTHPFGLWYYPMVVSVSYVLFIPALYFLKKNWHQRLSPLLWWAGFVFVFFSLAKNRLHHYMLFLYPPLAIMTGATIKRAYLRVVTVLAVVLLVGMLALAANYERIRFVPRAVQLIREKSPERLFFYKSDDAAIVFYTRRCIETKEDRTNLK
ncbi:MAG: glycosyltransferase family 39 protein, partial [Nitrospirae bacterium]